VVLGTIGYMSPEQVRGLQADHRSDIFSFGTVLSEMLSGQRAFRGETTMDAMTAILKEEPPSLPAVERQIPPAAVARRRSLPREESELALQVRGRPRVFTRGFVYAVDDRHAEGCATWYSARSV
jgi:serine/threonine protein kinase